MMCFFARVLSLQHANHDESFAITQGVVEPKSVLVQICWNSWLGERPKENPRSIINNSLVDRRKGNFEPGVEWLYAGEASSETNTIHTTKRTESKSSHTY